MIFSQVDAKEAPSSAQPDSGLVHQFGRHFTVDEKHGLANYSMFYVGSEGPELTNFMLSWNQCPFSSFNPKTGEGRWETLDVNRALRRRLYLVERARDAQVVGIVVGTLGVANYMSVLEHLQGIVQQAGKRAYTLAVGKPSPAKLANFLEVDIFVLVACPQNSLLDSSDFYRPLVTPYEMEMACNPARAWTGRYVTDFCCLLPGKAMDFSSLLLGVWDGGCGQKVVLFIPLLWRVPFQSPKLHWESEVSPVKPQGLKVV